MNPKVPTWFCSNNLDALLAAIPSSDSSGLYLPLNPQFENIDALVLEYNQKANTLNVMPIQVTIGKRHKDSETLFYNKWKKWGLRFPGIMLNSMFIWIVEQMKLSTTIKEDVQKTRTMLQVKMQIHVSLQRMCISLWEKHSSVYKIRQCCHRGGSEIKTPALEADIVSWFANKKGTIAIFEATNSKGLCLQRI